ncbi:hypothetical protein ACIBTP_18380 [Streptomyces avidinii]|uniref:hypothetical protein n=1 Tax=Streptomyces avidinii TaxID=1895 RepID=UPI00378F9CDA
MVRDGSGQGLPAEVRAARHHAASHPLLPLPRLVELLGATAEGMARTAARNHALPHDLMHRLLDIAGVER